MFNIVLENQWLQFFIVVVVGLMLGSFTTAVIYRERMGQSWIWNSKHDKNKVRSFCPKCQHILSVKDLIPVLSWVFQSGRCRYCKNKISYRYVITELSLLVLCLVCWRFFDFSIVFLLLASLLPFVVAQVVLLFSLRKLSTLLCAIIFMGIILLFFY